MTSDKSQGLILSVLSWEEYSSEEEIEKILPEFSPTQLHDLLIIPQKRNMIHKRGNDYKLRPIK